MSQQIVSRTRRPAGGPALKTKADEQTDEQGEGQIDEKWREIKIGVIGKTAFFPKQKWKSGPTNIIGAGREAEYGWQTTIRTHVGGQ